METNSLYFSIEDTDELGAEDPIKNEGICDFLFWQMSPLFARIQYLSSVTYRRCFDANFKTLLSNENPIIYF